ncbi:MAG: hypothetical protein IAG10_03730 [Planctomycetaceae bacterium]|nr:hypothetical protein [Planctomycetaceae bacterium]
MQRTGRQIRHGFGLIIHANVGVPHRQLDIGVTSQLLSFWQRSSVSQKFCNVGVTAGRMKIGEPIRVLVGDANSFQVFFHHQPCLPPL